MQQDIHFKITANSEVVEYDDLLKILHRAIDTNIFSSNQKSEGTERMRFRI